MDGYPHYLYPTYSRYSTICSPEIKKNRPNVVPQSGPNTLFKIGP